MKPVISVSRSRALACVSRSPALLPALHEMVDDCVQREEMTKAMEIFARVVTAFLQGK